MLVITSKEAIDKIYSINDNFEILSEFKGWREPILRKCKTCGDKRSVQARALIEKTKDGNIRGCRVCKSKERAIRELRKTHEEFINELYDINPNIKILTNYEKNDKNVKCKCLIDGYEWETTPHVLLQNHGCPECARKLQNRRNEEEFLLELSEKQPNIIPLTQFTQSKDIMRFKCLLCGHEWETQAYILVTRDGYSCPKCKNHASVTENEFIKRMERFGDFVEYINGYTDMSTHANFRCKKCGHEWDTLPTSILTGRGCPKCRMSKGEKKIYKILTDKDIDFKTQYIFEECKDIRSLPFDFYIKSLNMCIEYDGIQHFEPTKFNKKISNNVAQENFIAQKYRDEIKNTYCKNNNINLLRIPYTEFNNIEIILNKYLS